MLHGRFSDLYMFTYGLVPARYFNDVYGNYFTFGQQIASFLTFMFLHGGFWHLLGNMWFLYIFGDNVEEFLGPFAYLLFYLLCGITSGLCHILLNTDSTVPVIGASGAIAGIMGAYFLLYPNAKILTLIPIIIIPWFIEIPAFLYLGFWFIIQLINAAGSHGNISNIAWWAHIGGFFSGMILLRYFKKIPGLPISANLQKVAARKKTPRFQVVSFHGMENDLNLYGDLEITRFEAIAGTRKTVNLAWGFYKKPHTITVPANIKHNDTICVHGMGKSIDGINKGDLILKISIL